MGDQIQELDTSRLDEGTAINTQIADKAPKPDLRTLEGAKSYLDYHAPNENTLPRHALVNERFQWLITHLWDALPDGPGKTVAIRAIGRARMECNSCIANGGQ